MFENPTIHLLASAIVSLIQSSSAVTHESIRVTELISKFSTGLPPSRARIDGSVSTDTVVILTGSTGSLGAHLLAILLKEPQITKVFTLDRGEHIAARQKRSFSEKALPITILASEKLIRVTVDLSRDDLGIDSRILDEVRNSCYLACPLLITIDRSNHLRHISSTMHGKWISTYPSSHSKAIFRPPAD